MADAIETIIALAYDRNHWDACAEAQAELESLRAHLTTAETERDRARDYLASLHGGQSYQQVDELVTRCEAAEARVEALEAVRAAAEAVIADSGAAGPWNDLEAALARAALACPPQQRGE